MEEDKEMTVGEMVAHLQKLPQDAICLNYERFIVYDPPEVVDGSWGIDDRTELAVIIC